MRLVLAAAVVAAALVQLADASCPNQCSGHGRCGAFDKCECFRSAGLNSPYRYGYKGPDCSQRACPTGRAYDAIGTGSSSLSPITFTAGPGSTNSKEKLVVNYAPGSRTSSFINLRRDQTFVVRIQSVDTSDGTVIGRFAWRFEEDDAFEYETTIYSSTDDTTARELMKTGTDGRPIATGVSVFWDATLKGTTAFAGEIAVGDEYRFTLPYNEGITFDESDSNTAHLEVECSGRGSCDGATGKCKCQKGYTGSACERTECPNACSGHGTCQSEARFVADANISGAKYAGGYDGTQQYGCKCDAGYRGADCAQIECPSTSDPLGGDGGSRGRDCSGRGACDYSTGLCKCFKGYTGESCNVQNSFS